MAMTLHLISINHAEHGLDAVEAATPAIPGLARRLLDDHGVQGAVVLSTCNRVEVYLDADAPAPAVTARVRDALADAVPAGLPVRIQQDVGVLEHLFAVGAGLDSVVVGEREIAGQLRDALRVAHREGTATGTLTDVIENALRTSRQVSSQTRIGSAGRSVVSVGLDLLRRDWARTRVLLIGTGAYAGAVVADLTARGCADIAVHSSTGRAAAFAEHRPGVHAAEGDLLDAVAEADVVITCRGRGTTVLTATDVALAAARRTSGELVLVDLSLTHDIDPAAFGIAGVVLLDLRTIQRHVPEVSRRELTRARALVDAGVQAMVDRLKGRQVAPAVVALRDTVNEMVADEVARLPQGRPISADEAAHALRRLAARLVHVPSVRARQAAQEGRADEYLSALSELWGIGSRPVSEPADPARPAAASGPFQSTPLVTRRVHDDPVLAGPALVGEPVRPDTLDCDTCPITGLRLSDLGAPAHSELGDRERQEVL